MAKSKTKDTPKVHTSKIEFSDIVGHKLVKENARSGDELMAMIGEKKITHKIPESI